MDAPMPENAKNEDPGTALHHASSKNDLDMVGRLLEQGADINARNDKNETPFQAALEGHNYEIARFLIDRGCVIDLDKVDPVEHGKYYWEERPVVGLANWAIFKGDVDFARTLIGKGLNPKWQGPGGITLLHAAAGCGELFLCKLLLDGGCSRHSRTRDYYRPVAMAAANGHIDIVKIFLHRGDAVESKGDCGKPPLLLAVRNGHYEVVRYLIDHGADADADVDYSGWKLLHSACFRNRPDIVAALLEAGAQSTYLTSQQGASPLSIAIRDGYAECAKLLENYGGKTSWIGFGHHDDHPDDNLDDREKADFYFDLGWKASHMGFFIEAAGFFTKAISLNPLHARAYQRRGYDHGVQCRYELAIKDLTKAIEIDPNYADAILSRGITYLEAGQYELAVGDMTRLAALDPSKNDAYSRRANAYMSLNRYEEAAGDYSKLIETEQGSSCWFRERALANSKHGNRSSALEDLAKAEDLETGYWVYENAGECYEILGDLPSAIESYSKAIASSPRPQSEYYKKRAEVFKKMGDGRRAEEDFDRAKQIKMFGRIL